jgi:hypothetical protein
MTQMGTDEEGQGRTKGKRQREKTGHPQMKRMKADEDRRRKGG